MATMRAVQVRRPGAPLEVVEREVQSRARGRCGSR
jgi:hypothetical protein